VGGDYFAALRIPVLQGRALNAHDDLRGAPYAVVMNESLARHLFAGEVRRAIGEQVRFYAWQDSAWTIVGVVGDVKTDALDEPARPTIYYSHLQGPANRMSIVARATGADPRALIPAMRRQINRLDPSVAVYAAGTMVERVARSQAVYSRRYLLLLLGTFAVAALLLAIIGVYGVIAYAVTQRTREIAIRIALGAESGEVLAMLLRGGLRLVGAGIAIGAVAALALSRTLASLLFGVSPADAWTYALTALALTIVAVLASYLPARRATRFDPAMTLRAE
jgi:predicted permease